jgi:hypothetical protein
MTRPAVHGDANDGLVFQGPGVDHEPPGRGADEVEGTKRDQRELAPAARLDHARFVGIDDFG